MAELEREEEAVKWVEPSNIQIGPHRLNHRQTHSETAECAGDVFLKGNPGASERGGTIPLTHTLIPSSGDWALQLGQSSSMGSEATRLQVPCPGGCPGVETGSP